MIEDIQVGAPFVRLGNAFSISSSTIFRAHLRALTIGLLLLLSTAVYGQDTIQQVRLKAADALQKGAYQSAALYLQELIDRLGGSHDASTRATLDTVHFNLGLCYFLSGQFEPAEKQFKRYIRLYPKSMQVVPAEVFATDSMRYRSKFKRAIREYERILQRRRVDADWRTDILCSLARCYLAQDDWEGAIPVLERAYATSPDRARSSWAATLLTTAYVQSAEFEKVYNLVPFVLQENSFAERSAAFNLSALQMGDQVFAAEKYRHALWIYRLIFPKPVIEAGCRKRLERLELEADRIRSFRGGQYRKLLRIQESIGEMESELEALAEVEEYGEELRYRIARSYFEVKRYWEALAAFLDLHETSVEEDRQEESLFYAFLCSTQINRPQRLFKVGRQYMDTYPGGPHYDPVSLAVGQTRAQRKEWLKTIAVLTEALDISPKHESIAECMFLIGYSHFMEEHYTECVDWLERLNKEYPGNERMMEAAYWSGMGHLFNTDYEDGLETFTYFLADFPDSPYHIDAQFRHAVCLYGLSRFDSAEFELARFVERNADAPQAKQLLGEAYMMLGDCAGNFGRAGQAIEHYKAAVRHDVNIAHYNYCYFRAAEMMGDNGRWAELVRHFETYIEDDREGANIPMAVFWIGKALWQQEEYEEALGFFLESVEKYGRERDALGVDLILDEWVGRSRKLDEKQVLEAWNVLVAMHQRAKEAGEDALRLRLARAFLYRPGQGEGYRDDMLDILVQKENIPHASGAVLELIMEEAKRRGRDELALLAAREIVKVFTETDYVIGARLLLGRRAAEQGDLKDAKKHFDVIITQFASTQSAGQALMRLGRAYFDKNDLKEADDCFKRILDVREWKGALWPEALFMRGECLRIRGRYRKASAFYERIYILYGAFPRWVANAYYRRAWCLARLNQYTKARETLQEMFDKEKLAEYEVHEEATQFYQQLKAAQR